MRLTYFEIEKRYKEKVYHWFELKEYNNPIKYNFRFVILHVLLGKYTNKLNSDEYFNLMTVGVINDNGEQRVTINQRIFCDRDRKQVFRIRKWKNKKKYFCLKNMHSNYYKYKWALLKYCALRFFVFPKYNCEWTEKQA
jgi:hypothetical protein